MSLAGAQLVECYERIRAQQRGDRGWGAELLRRQGMAAWVQITRDCMSAVAPRRESSRGAMTHSTSRVTREALIEGERLALSRVLADMAAGWLRKGL